jgi:Protein of unknown function (DUF3352)
MLGRRLALLLLALLALVSLAAGCGGGSGSSKDDPASLAPAATPFYAEAVVHPEGVQRDNAEAILGKILDSPDGPGALHDLLTKAMQRDAPGATYERDIEPWLGDRIGVAVGPSGRASAVSVIVATTDPDKALAAARKGRKAPIAKKSYKEVDYETSGDDEAVAVIGDFLVGGNEAGVRQAIDASKGDALAASDRYEAAVDDAPDARLGFMYVDPKRVIEAATSTGGVDPMARGILQNALGGADGQPILAVAKAEQDAVLVETTGTLKGPLATFAGVGTPLSGELPGDSWIAFGQHDLGGALRSLVDNAGSLGIPGVNSSTARFFVKQRFGIDIDRDLLSWMGDAALFVRGTSKDSVGGGLVIEATNAEAAKAGVTKLAFLARALGQDQGLKVSGGNGDLTLRSREADEPIRMVADGDRVYLTYGEDALRAARDGGDRLADSAAWKTAAASLHGPQPSLFVDLRRVWKLVDASESGDDPRWKEARRYLDALASFAAGAEKDGDRTRSVAAVAVP